MSLVADPTAATNATTVGPVAAALPTVVRIDVRGPASSRAPRPPIDDLLLDALPHAQSVLSLRPAGHDIAPELQAHYRERHPGVRWRDAEAHELASLEAGAYDLLVVADGLPAHTAEGDPLDLLARAGAPGAALMLQFESAVTIEALTRLIEADNTDTDPGRDPAQHSIVSLYKRLMDAGWMPTIGGHRVGTPVRRDIASAALALADLLAIPRGSATRTLSMQRLLIRAHRSFDEAPLQGDPRGAFSVVVPTTRERQLAANVERSPGLREVDARIVVCRDAANPAQAFDAALGHCSADWVLLCHQDIYFPRGFGRRLQAVLAAIAPEERARTLIGFAGMGVNAQTHASEPAGFVVDRLEAADHPPNERAMSIDELAIVVSRDTLHRIDPAMGWHLWATDLCLAAICRHRVFARIVRMPVFHNSVTDFEVPAAFMPAAAKLAAKYPDFPSIPTLCATIDADFLAGRTGNLRVAHAAVATPAAPPAAPTPAAVAPAASPTASLSLDLPAANAQLDALLGAGRLDDALLAMAQAVHETYLQPGVAHNALYYPAFDRRIEALAARLDTHLPPAGPVQTGRHLIIATELYALGGHSKVIEDLSHEVAAPVLLLTDMFGTYHKDPTQLNWVRERFAHGSVVVVPALPLWQKCLWLGELTRKLGPASISYLAHHQDPVAYVATLAQPGARKLFFHHADHNPALGCTLEGLRHVDLSPALQSLCGSGLAEAPTLLPMHVADQGAKRFSRIAGRSYSVVTSGHPAKFARSGPVALQSIVRAALGSIDGRFFHIGPLDEGWVGEIRAALAAAGLDPARFVALGQVPSLWTTLREIDAAFYIGSAPVAGGRGSIEAQGCGLPVLFFDGFESGPLVENYSLFADRSLGWGSVDALAALLGRVGKRHNTLSREARAFYARSYSHASFRRAVVDLIGA